MIAPIFLWGQILEIREPKQMNLSQIEKATYADSIDLVRGHCHKAVLEFLLDSVIESGENDESFHNIVEQLQMCSQRSIDR